MEMARGPVPKEHRSRAYDSPVLDEVPAAVVVPYELPVDLLPVGEDHWHPATVRWWSRWVESPLAARLPAVDWSELEATAVLHHEFMRKRTFSLAGELRLRMAAFGATPADRMRLKIKVVEGVEPGPARGGAGVTDMTSRRDRLSKGA
jgi:hypothetical protein